MSHHHRDRRAADRLADRKVLPDWKAPPYRDIEMKIGKGLKAHYDLPMDDLPHRLLTLVLQMDKRPKEE